MASPTPAELFERHHLVLYRFLRRMTGDPVAAEDLVQEVFVRVVKGVETYEDREREQAWLFRIARNVLVDCARSRGRRPAPASLDAAAAIPIAPRQTLAAELDDALDGVNSDDREAFLLREVGGLGYEEIAALTSATADAVRSRIYRARRELRSILSPQLARGRRWDQREARS